MAPSWDEKIAARFARAAATAAARRFSYTSPLSWEFGGFSQHGEDGIIDTLCGLVSNPDRFFVEIGSSDGVENCSSWLALARKYSGIMIEGNEESVRRCRQLLRGRAWSVDVMCMMVDAENAPVIAKACPSPTPDFLALDIDGLDYHVMSALLGSGLRPKIISVEYNSVFGPDQCVTVPNSAPISRWDAHKSGLYYGASVGAWRKLLEPTGYRFVTVDSCGVNAFFVECSSFDEGFLNALDGLAFRDNQTDRNGATAPSPEADGFNTPRRSWTTQFPLIAHLPLVQV